MPSLMAHAEGGCPVGRYPMSGQGWQNCVPIPGYAQQQPQAIPQPPSSKWESRWGAIASDFQEGALGVATDMKSREAAEEAAKADCRENGGVICILETWYSNSCAAMILGDTKHSTNNAPTLNEAIQLGMEKCQRDTTNCEVYYKACSMPVRIR